MHFTLTVKRSRVNGRMFGSGLVISIFIICSFDYLNFVRLASFFKKKLNTL